MLSPCFIVIESRTIQFDKAIYKKSIPPHSMNICKHCPSTRCKQKYITIREEKKKIHCTNAPSSSPFYKHVYHPQIYAFHRTCRGTLPYNVNNIVSISIFNPINSRKSESILRAHPLTSST